MSTETPRGDERRDSAKGYDFRKTTFTTTSTAPAYTRTYQQVKAEYDQLNPAQISAACVAWTKTASVLETLATDLRLHAGDALLDAWTSAGSTAAQQQLQLAQGTVSALANECLLMSEGTGLAAGYAEKSKASFPAVPAIEGLTEAQASGALMRDAVEAANQKATEHLVTFMSEYNAVIEGHVPPEAKSELVTPSEVGQVAPGGVPGAPVSGGAGGVGQVNPTGSVPAGSVPGADSSGSGGVPGIGGVTTSGIGPIGTAADDPFAAGSALAGSGAGTVAGAGSGALSGASALGSPGVGYGATSGSNGLGGGLAGLGAAGVGAGLAPGLTGRGSTALGAGLAPGASGTGIGGRAGTGTGGIAGAGTGAGGRGMVPMHGAGAGAGTEEERERSTWLSEDDDVWAGDDAVSPSVITG